jgi:uncharacterized cupredoxin-like copper-binding protein
MRLHIAGVALALAIGSEASLSHEPKSKSAPRPVSTQETAFGREGDPGQVSRIIQIDMNDHLRFRPGEIVIKQDETIRFNVKNSGRLMHEMVLGAMSDLKEHARHMRTHAAMDHDEPHMAPVAPGNTGTLVWQFTKPGEFHYACLVPGHLEAGMVGKVKVLAR